MPKINQQIDKMFGKKTEGHKTYENIPVSHKDVWQQVVDEAAKHYNDKHPDAKLGHNNFTRFSTVMDEWFHDETRDGPDKSHVLYHHKNDTYILDPNYVEGFNQLGWDMSEYYYGKWLQ